MGAAEPTTPFFWFERKKGKNGEQEERKLKKKSFGKMKL
jgi:hypothetical protein